MEILSDHFSIVTPTLYFGKYKFYFKNKRFVKKEEGVVGLCRCVL